jgi:spore maturation protein CgeB
VKLNIVILGLSITSSWGNGHATTYRGLVRELVSRGHNVVFLERDVPWYAENRDYRQCRHSRIGLYRNLKQLQTMFGSLVRDADLVIVGSYVPDGIWIGEWVVQTANGITAFYDIDTPVTLAKLERDECDYLTRDLISKYQLYLSFTGGPTLQKLEEQYASPMARALYCSVDPNLYFPRKTRTKWALGYLGTYSDDRQPSLEALLLNVGRTLPDKKFVVAGPQYPPTIRWPGNVQRIVHLAPNLHCDFYNRQSFTLNITRADMKKAGFSPSVRLFEAAACGTPIISDYWDGLETILEPGKEVLVSGSTEEAIQLLNETSPSERRALGERARARILAEHTAAHRAAELESYALKLLSKRRRIVPVRKNKKRQPQDLVSKDTL